MRRISAFIFLLCCAAAGGATAKECTKYEAYTAESLYPYLSSWNEVHMAYQAYGHCNDGAIAEGFDEAISLLWANHWEQVPEMLRETSSDAGFNQFVFKRIGSETIPMERWQKIVDNAKAHCPSVAQSFCREVIGDGSE